MNIYVGNLPLDVAEEELRREFMAFGEVKSVGHLSLARYEYSRAIKSRAEGFQNYRCN